MATAGHDANLNIFQKTCSFDTHVCHNLHPAGSLGVGVELEQGAQVLEGVAAQAGSADGARLGWVHHALDLVRVDETGQVWVGHGQARQVEARLLLGGLCVCACKVTDLLDSSTREQSTLPHLNSRNPHATRG